MKTKELVKKANEIRLLIAVDKGGFVSFREETTGNEFYNYPVWGTERGDGNAKLSNAGDIYMVHLFKLMDLLDEYRQTPESEREDPKLYRVKFPAITRGGRSIYLARNTGDRDPIGIDWSPKDYIVDEFPDNYIFTEQEVKDINCSYWEFAEEVTE